MVGDHTGQRIEEMIEPLIDSCENEDVKKTLRRKWMVNDQGSNTLEASDAV